MDKNDEWVKPFRQGYDLATDGNNNWNKLSGTYHFYDKT